VEHTAQPEAVFLNRVIQEDLAYDEDLSIRVEGGQG
jgi:hypothetical protein